MSGAPQPRGWAELPADVLHLIASTAREMRPRGRPGIFNDQPLKDPPLLLRDVLSAASVCTAWRQALASPDIDSLTIGGAT